MVHACCQTDTSSRTELNQFSTLELLSLIPFGSEAQMLYFQTDKFRQPVLPRPRMVHSIECVTVVTIKDMESYNGVSFFTCLLLVLNLTKMVDVMQSADYYINYVSDSKTGGET